MEEPYLDEMEPPCRGLVLAIPGRTRMMVHKLADKTSEPHLRVFRRRPRTVACGFPERRLRMSLRIPQLRLGG